MDTPMIDLQKLLDEATPGPWVAIASIPLEGWNGWVIQAQPHPALRGFTKSLADIHGPQGDVSRAANARLIAMAPDMLAALIKAKEAMRGLIDRYDEVVTTPNCSCSQDDYDVVVARRALSEINKLTGE